jgi:formate hydrogenlyase subunit 3/multisubunit Na+/H+ antiporter MnhD subunit
LIEIINPKSIFGLTLILYPATAFVALLLMKNQRVCNIVTNALCVFTSLIGAIGALIYLIMGREKLVWNIFNPGIPFLKIDVSLDKLSAFFILGLSILVFCVSIYSIGYISHYFGKRNVGLFNFLYVGFIFSMLIVIMSGNAIIFLIAWEAMAVISYLLVVFESEQQENQKAGLIYIVMTHIGTAFIMIAFMIIYSYTGSFNIFNSSIGIPGNIKDILFILFFIGFGTKAGLVPVHIWLPHAHPAAPSNISALMSGIMIKTAIYGMLRFVYIFLGTDTIWWGTAVLSIGLISAFLGVAYAYVEQNIKKILAYSSIENMGIIFTGLGISMIALARDSYIAGALALTAVLLHTFNHSLFKGSLFLGAGSIHYATHSKEIEDMGGLIKKMPIAALFFLGGSLSIAAIVPFNGFISEWLLLQSFFAGVSPGNAELNIMFILGVTVIALCGALAAACFIKLFGITFLGLPRSTKSENAKEVPKSMNIGSGILVTLCLISGMFPLIILSMIDKVVIEIIGQPISSQLIGGFMMAYYPLNINSNIIAPQWIPFIMGAVFVIAIAFIRVVGGKYKERRYGTWDCGYEALNPRMQYSGTAFSKPLRIVFRMIFKSSRNLKATGNLKYHPESLEYTLTTESLFETHFYDPILKFATEVSKRLKFMIQTGSLHTYLIYIFVTVLLLMLYNRIA